MMKGGGGGGGRARHAPVHAMQLDLRVSGAYADGCNHARAIGQCVRIPLSFFDEVSRTYWAEYVFICWPGREKVHQK